MVPWLLAAVFAVCEQTDRPGSIQQLPNVHFKQIACLQLTFDIYLAHVLQLRKLPYVHGNIRDEPCAVFELSRRCQRSTDVWSRQTLTQRKEAIMNAKQCFLHTLDTDQPSTACLQLDAVMLATPDSLHAPQVAQCRAEADMKI
jgi:hypothetical protein